MVNSGPVETIVPTVPSAETCAIAPWEQPIDPNKTNPTIACDRSINSGPNDDVYSLFKEFPKLIALPQFLQGAVMDPAQVAE
jgi:hypothetical protein